MLRYIEWCENNNGNYSKERESTQNTDGKKKVIENLMLGLKKKNGVKDAKRIFRKLKILTSNSSRPVNNIWRSCCCECTQRKKM